MLLAWPHAGASPALRCVSGVIAAGVPLISAASGGCANEPKSPAMVLPSLDADSVKLKGPPRVNVPALDQRGSLLPLLGSSVAMALLPPTNSLKRIFPSGCQPSHAAEAFLSFVRFFASPPSVLMVKMSPPVRPSSLMMPSMKAIRLPSGDHTGLATCSLGL